MRWLAICANGAVSLGTFESGVVAQIYADAHESGAVAIDAVAGASAGAVTVLLLAQAVATGSTPAEFTDRLWKTWVEGLSMQNLLGDTTNPANAMFDPGSLTKLSAEVVIREREMEILGYQTAGRPIVVSIALTNLDGIPCKTNPEDPDIVSMLHGDNQTVIVNRGIAHRVSPKPTLKSATGPSALGRVTWDEMTTLAIASSAYPFAFRTQTLSRDLIHYPGAIGPSSGAMEAKFNYSDGGLLDNNPLGRAIDAVKYAQSMLPGHEFDSHDFVVIDPDPLTEADARKAVDDLQESRFTHGLEPQALAPGLVLSYFNSALYRDLQQAAVVNANLAALQKLVDQKLLDEGQRKRVVDALDIEHKRQVRIHRIVPVSGYIPLLGAFSGHFGGFFSKAYRNYDFGAGCEAGRAWFTSWALKNGVKPAASVMQRSPGVRPTKQEFAGVNADEINIAKTLIAQRIEAVVHRSMHLHGLAQIIDSLGEFLVHKAVRIILNKALK